MVKKFLSECLGTAFLLSIVVGSGIMGSNLSQGNDAIALLANSIATGAGLFVLIQNLGPVSGAHFNPIVSFVEWLWGRLDLKGLLLYCLAQILGGLLGVIVAHGMFNLEIFQVSTKLRVGSHLFISEVVATFGLISTIFLAGRKNIPFAPLTIAAYITSAYWFTSSTSFANPAVTIARIFTNTFCGISPQGVWAFLLAQLLGAGLAFLLTRRMDSFSNSAT